MKKSTAFTLAEVSSTTCAGGRKNGFTLAEVLITLGIIGVVAAMTMPTLINQTNGAQYKTAYKKALSAISQAVTLNVALDDESFADTIAGEAGKTTAGNGATDATKTEGTTVGSLLNARMNIVGARTANESGYGTTTTGEGSSATTSSNFIGTVETCKTWNTTDPKKCDEKERVTPDTFLFLNDGIMFAYKAADAKKCTEDNKCSGVIDVNGIKGPNKIITCDGQTDPMATVATCEVKSPTDIYPVVFFDQTVLPATDAGKAVLYGK